MKTQKNICKNDHVNLERRNDQIIISILGDFDNSTTPLVHQCCKTLQKNDDIKKIILDFQKAGRVDSSAFACILNYVKENKGSATEILVTNLREREEGLLQILRIDKTIRVE